MTETQFTTFLSFLTTSRFSNAPGARGDDTVLVWVTGLVGFVILLSIYVGVTYVVYYLFSLPMRRQERVQFLLDLLETAEKGGKSFEDAVVATALSGDGYFGQRFRVLAGRLVRGYRLDKALGDLPRILPPQILAVLQVGIEIGDLRRVLPACRKLLADGNSRIMAATNYLIPLTLLFTPVGIITLPFLAIVILPKFQEIFHEMLEGAPLPALTWFIITYRSLIAVIQLAMMFLLALAVLFYTLGPLLVPGLQDIHSRVCYLIPWRRKRLQRDFSGMLAILLDAHLPEPRAVTLAAQGTANRILMRRSADVVRRLEAGLPLADALRGLDDSGEFQWRLRNAAHTHIGLAGALAGWHDSLDARAYQQEQAAAQLITTGLVLLNGSIVGVVVVGLFQALAATIQRAALW